MAKTLQLLVLDSGSADPDAWQEALTAAAWSVVVKRPATEDALCAALTDGAWDLCLCAADAAPGLLRRLRDHGLPWIVVAPGLESQETIDSLRAGATDCATASELATAVERALASHGPRRRAEHRRAIDELAPFAGRTAHDLNNLLTIIQGYGDLLVEDLAGTPDQLQIAHELLDAAQRAARFTTRLMTLGRRRPPSAETLELEGFLAGRKAAWTARLSADIDLSVLADDPPLSVRVAAVDLERILGELVDNAGEAMAQGGRLEIMAQQADDALLPNGLAAGSYALLRVRDSGHGVAEELATRVFEPYVTTKPKQNGSGLGLAIVLRLVTQSGGAVTLESGRDHGTTVAVYLPRPGA